MKNKTRVLGLVVSIPLAISGCQLTDEEKEKLNDAQVDLEQLADQIIITYPANNSMVADSIVTVRADIPEAAEAQEVILFVDGVEVAKDADGAPWELSWPSYYWADGGAHTLLLKAITGGGNEVRNNQQFQVTIDGAANNLLKFDAGIDDATFKDENSLTVEFDEFPGATRYEVKYSTNNADNVIETQSLGVELTNLDVGEYELNYRAIMENSGLTTLEGPWSNPVTFEVSPPDLPNILPPELIYSGGEYDLLFSWGDLGEGNTYKIELESLADDRVSSVYDDVNDNKLLVTGLGIGEYRWRLIRTNSLGHKSLPSDHELIEVGVFTKYLGGTRDDNSKQIIHSRDGGYIVLGYTYSNEVSDSVDSQGDDWIFKLNSQGDILWQYVPNAGGKDRFNDIIELSDGSIMVVGTDWASNKAIVQFISEEGELIRETLYRPSELKHRYDFLDVVEANDSIYVSSKEWGEPVCVKQGGCTSIVGYNIHTIDPDSGAVSDPLSIPALAGLQKITISELARTKNGQLIVAGAVLPEGTNRYDYTLLDGAYLQVLDGLLDTQVSWDNSGEYLHSNIGDIIALDNNRFVVIGQAMGGGNPAISLIEGDGTLYREFTGGHGFFYRPGTPIVSGLNGEFYGLFSNYSSDTSQPPISFVSFTSELNIKSTEHLFSRSVYIRTSGFVKNDDGTYTFLLSTSPKEENSNFDIVVVKKKY